MKYLLSLILIICPTQFCIAAAGDASEECIKSIAKIHAAVKVIKDPHFGHEERGPAAATRDFSILTYRLNLDHEGTEPSAETGRIALKVLSGFNTDERYEHSRANRDNTAQKHHDLIAAMVLFHLPEEAGDARIWLRKRHAFGWLSETVGKQYVSAVPKLVVVKEKKPCCWCFPFFN